MIDGHSEWSRSAATVDRYIPQVVFTDPQVASVGLTEKDAKHLGLNTRSIDSEMGIVVDAQLHTDGYVGHARLVYILTVAIIYRLPLYASQLQQ